MRMQVAHLEFWDPELGIPVSRQDIELFPRDPLPTQVADS